MYGGVHNEWVIQVRSCPKVEINLRTGLGASQVDQLDSNLLLYTVLHSPSLLHSLSVLWHWTVLWHQLISYLCKIDL